jgi:transcriptional regulator with XRE-family HTH domain
MPHLGLNIKAERVRAGLRQADLAERVGLSTAAICHIERGVRDPKATLLQSIARALDVSIESLLSDRRGGNIAA